MIMPPRLRKFVLTSHIVSSVGWLGAVVAFVGIAVVALTSQDPATVRGALLVMTPIGWYVLIPLVFASLVTGIIQALGSKWGLIRHYWVLFKLVIGVVSTYVLLLFATFNLNAVQSGAADPASSVDELRALAGSPRDHALLALAGLLLAAVLAVYKPRAMTGYGQRKQDNHRSKQAERRAEATAAARPRAGALVPDPPGSPGTSDDTDVGTDRRPARGLPRWVKATGFILGVLAWAVAMALVLGGGGGPGGGHGSSGDTPGVNQEKQPAVNLENESGADDGRHGPPRGIPDHGQ